MANYSYIEEMLNTTENMQHLVVSTGHDDDTMTFDGVDWFMFNGIKASSLYVSGNSWIGLGANTEQFLVCRRDAKMWDFYRVGSGHLFFGRCVDCGCIHRLSGRHFAIDRR